MSDTRIPTMSLRFVEREVIDINFGVGFKKVRVLQQMFETTGGKRFWEDVPLAFEEKPSGDRTP